MGRVVRHDGVTSLRAAAERFLLVREAEHNLILGICSSLEEDTYDEAEAYLATVHGDRDAPVVVAVRTPPHNLVLSCCDDVGVLRELADDVAASDHDLPGVTGPTEVSAGFARIWSEVADRAAVLEMRMRIHRATSAHVPTEVPGALCEAGEVDLDLLVRWGMAFQREAVDDDVDEERARAWAQRLVGSAAGGLVLWEVEGVPVSLAGYGGPTPNGIRISAVYTPPELRGRGYGGACVATLTARLLETRRFCFLFTDLANPTSNRLYARIGYEPVMAVDAHRFEG